MLLVSANEKELQYQVCREQTEIELLRKKLRQATYQLRQIKSKLMDYINVKHDKSLNFLLGIPSDSLFRWILSLIRSDIPSILKSFRMENNLLLILMKLKLGTSNQDLSLKFEIKEEYLFKLSELGY